MARDMEVREWQAMMESIATQTFLSARYDTELAGWHIKAMFHALRSMRNETVSWPADWWQALKLRWFPAWLKRRYPVKMERRTVRYICPHVVDRPVWASSQEAVVHFSWLQNLKAEAKEASDAEPGGAPAAA